MRRTPTGGGGAISQLSDVDLTALTDGDVLQYSNATSYAASFSPLTWDGTDYDDPQFGASVASFYFILGPSGVNIVDTDGQPVGYEGSGNLHIAMIDLDGLGTSGFVTFVVVAGFTAGFGQPDTRAGLQASLRAIIAPALVIDNYKANAYTAAAGALTFQGLTGFDEAGAVTVSAGGTTPPAIDFVEGTQRFVNVELSTRLFMETNSKDAAQTVATATETALEFMDSGINGSGADYFFDEEPDELSFDNDGAANTDDLMFLIDVREDSGDFDIPIPTGIIRLKRKNGSDTYVTIAESQDGQPLAVSPESLSSDLFQITIEQSSGGNVDVVPYVRAYFEKPAA